MSTFDVEFLAEAPKATVRANEDGQSSKLRHFNGQGVAAPSDSMKQFKSCGYCYRGSRAHAADCPFEKYRIKHWKIVSQDYLNPKP